MTMKTTLSIKTDPDFIPDASRTIDIRKYFPSEMEKKEDDDVRYLETEEWEPYMPEIIVSESRKTERKRKQIQQEKREEKEYWQAWKFGIFRVLLSCMKKLLIFSIERYQKWERKLRAWEWGGINFDTQYTAETIFYLAISLPATVRNVEDVLLRFPLVSRKVAYRILRVRKEKMEMYDRVFNK